MYSPKFHIVAKIGKDTFKRDVHTVPFVKELFYSYTEDKSTLVEVYSCGEEWELVAKSRRGFISKDFDE